MSETKLITTGGVAGIYISPTARGAMQSIVEAEAVAGAGIKGDRYCDGIGSFNDVKRGRRGIGARQVSLMDARFFAGTAFEFADSRRNIITEGVELIWLLKRGGKEFAQEFRIGEAVFRAVDPLDPCNVPSSVSGKPGFKEAFFDCGAIIAEVLVGGRFRVGDPVFHASKGY
ncbi:MAG TPA: hypothetical protein VFQ72_01635 [Candidatus Paceibacterota bacterium]|nr:hypothetical protein [Candidatus Paceibacterota bacterium]